MRSSHASFVIFLPSCLHFCVLTCLWAHFAQLICIFVCAIFEVFPCLNAPTFCTPTYCMYNVCNIFVCIFCVTCRIMPTCFHTHVFVGGAACFAFMKLCPHFMKLQKLCSYVCIHSCLSMIPRILLLWYCAYIFPH